MNSLKFSEDETIVKDYVVAKIKKPTKGEAHVILTNKRAIIQYDTKKSALVSDVNINDVRGTDISWSEVQRKKLGIVASAVGAALIFFGIIGLFSYDKTPGISMLSAGIPIIASGIYFIVKKRTNIIIIVYTKSIVSTLTFHNLPTGIMARNLSQNKIELSGEPGPDADTMRKEIGVIIQDIQKSNKATV